MFKKTCFFMFTFLLSLTGFKNGGENNSEENKISIGIFHSPNQILNKSPKEQKHLLKQKTEIQNKKDSIDQNWLSKVIKNIKHEEYNIVYGKQTNAYESPNRKNNIDFIYQNNGFKAKTLMTKIPLFDVNDKTIKEKDKKYKKITSWKINFKLLGYTRNIIGSEITGFTGTGIKSDSNKAFIEDSNIRIDYLNNEEGMRQDFTIKKKPEGKGNLKLALNVITKLKMIVGSDALIFKKISGEEEMKYSSLKAYDSDGKLLRTYFQRQKNNNEFSIIVNDEDAKYPIIIDPLSSTPNWTATGENSYNYFGRSVSTAGDVNGDGYGDVIIGAYGYSSSKGKAYIYYGSSTGLSATPNWSAIGENTNDQFGISVTTAGDVNGDEYSDVIIGAYGYSSSKGKAYVYYGNSSGLSTTSNWTATGENSNDEFGISVSAAGDVNGDGYSDVIVGAFYYPNGNLQGKTYVYYGSSTGLSATVNWTSVGENNNDWFGWSISSAGDVNGDGYSDIIIGACGFQNNSFKGKTYLYYGSSTGLSITPNWTATGENANDNFGVSVSTAGDVNGDGFSDVIIGAYLYSNHKGKAYVYYGSTIGLSATPDWTATGENNYDCFGISVSTPGDVNGDGYSEVLVGAFYYSGITGKVYLYSGGLAGLSASPNWSAVGENINNYFGISVSTAGDVNGDGYCDVIIGASGYSGHTGKAYIYYGSATGLSTTSNWSTTGENTSNYFGYSVSTAGDVNGDGYSDVIIGAYYYSSRRGKAYVYYGSPTGLSTTPNWIATGENIYDYFGFSVSPAGDVNGDGYSDVIIGAYFYPTTNCNGKVYVYHGSSSGLSTTPNWTVTGENIGLQFGYSISTAGDVNGDGYSDVIIGESHYSSLTGKSFVYYGSPVGLSTMPDWAVIGENTSDQFGYSVSTAGDVNGDGYSDVIIGAPAYSSWKGKAYVYYGSITGLSTTPNWTVTGENSNDIFSLPVSTAGDVNGDGYSEVFIGAYGYSNYKGKTYVYYGSSIGLSTTPNWTALGENDYDQFGLSIYNAGDVNGDGYSDLIIGAYGYSGYKGKAYLYYGNSTGLPATSNWTATGENANDQYGSVSTAGDVNGDGYSDVIIGAYGNSTNTGKVFTYYGNRGTGLRSTLAQFKPGTNTIIGPGGLSGTNGQVRLSMFSKSPFGRTKGKLVYEFKNEGVPFSGSIITNSTGYTGMSSNWTDLTTSGITINNDISGIATMHEYKWRIRIKYNLASNPYQVFSSWKYYTNYTPIPWGCVKAQDGPLPANMNYFTFSIDENTVKLRWETSIEINNSGFEVQRKNPVEINWSKIGWVKGNGTTYIPKDYMFDDKKLEKADNEYRLRQIDYNGNFKYYNLEGIVSVSGPKDFKLSQNYPNPFNSKTNIKYQLPKDGFVTLKIYDITGREIETLVNEKQTAGTYEATFNASQYPSGVYFYRLKTEGFSETKKMILLK